MAVESGHLLLFGYLRNHDSSHSNTMIPEDVIKNVCLNFYLQRIDYFKPNYGAKIDINLNTFEVVPTGSKGNTYSSTYCISQYGWNKRSGYSGKHDMIIKPISHYHKDHGLSIGILTNPNPNTRTWLFDASEAGDTYQFHISNIYTPEETGIYHFNQQEGELKHLQNFNIDMNDKDDNSEIKMSMDCDNWMLSFYFDGKQVGKTIKIEPRDNYYAAIAYRNKSDQYEDVDSKYQMILHTRIL